MLTGDMPKLNQKLSGNNTQCLIEQLFSVKNDPQSGVVSVCIVDEH